MSIKLNQTLIKRFKSFTWRTGMMVLALAVQFALANLELMEIPPQITVIVGLVLGEISKELNNRYNLENLFGSTKN